MGDIVVRLQFDVIIMHCNLTLICKSLEKGVHDDRSSIWVLTFLLFILTFKMGLLLTCICIS